LVRVIKRHDQLIDDPKLKKLDRCSYHKQSSEEEKAICEKKCKEEDDCDMKWSSSKEE